MLILSLSLAFHQSRIRLPKDILPLVINFIKETRVIIVTKIKGIFFFEFSMFLLDRFLADLHD